MNKLKVLITGSNGMVGKNIVNNKNSNLYEFLTPTREDLDLLKLENVNEFLKSYKPNFIIHCAGLVGGIQANIENQFEFLESNTQIAINIIKAAKKIGIKNLINMASSCMYPKNSINPISEESILTGELEPTNQGYALSKIMATKMCEYISKKYKEFNYKTIIPCNLYGKYDSFELQKSHLIPAAIKKVHDAKFKEKKEVIIWGDGSARREFMYAEDLANFVYYAILNFESMPQNINVGLGIDYSINDYYKVIAEVIGYTGEFKYDLNKPVGMKRKQVKTDKLKKFGWKHKTSLTDGIKKTYNYLLEKIKNDK